MEPGHSHGCCRNSAQLYPEWQLMVAGRNRPFDEHPGGGGEVGAAYYRREYSVKSLLRLPKLSEIGIL